MHLETIWAVEQSPSGNEMVVFEEKLKNVLSAWL